MGLWGRFLFLLLVGLIFQRLLLLSVRVATATAPFDQCDQLEEELEAAQSKASNGDVNLVRLGNGHTSRSKAGCYLV
jgi:hypothetical protein